jgi:hypothetical protein
MADTREDYFRQGVRCVQTDDGIDIDLDLMGRWREAARWQYCKNYRDGIS